ncbi:MAG: glycosyl transferase [Acidobacteria bacterium]|nr:MAG: glycosyl transferase [Acidobacteriota bacterium]
MMVASVGAYATVILAKLAMAVALLGTASSTVFLILVLVAARRYRRLAAQARSAGMAFARDTLPPVAILKPIHNMEAELEQNLESFFLQDYPDYEIIFGARDSENAALRIAERVRARHPNVKSQVVLSGPPTWPNAKVFSLEKMIAATERSYFVISDSDVRADPDFLRHTIPPLIHSKVGLVTCMYRGIPAADFWSSLEALGLSVEMTSGVIVADMLEGMRFALGPAMTARRDAIDAIGGIATTADYYSDDFELGNRIWARGYQVVLSHYFVQNVLTPRSALRTLGDQLRWMKSTRYSRPAGHLGTGLTFAMPFGILGLIAGGALGHWTLGLSLFGIAIANRLIQSIAIGWRLAEDRRALSQCWLYPLRDLAGFFIWLGSYTSRRFYWRGETYVFQKGGRIMPEHRQAKSAVGDSY